MTQTDENTGASADVPPAAEPAPAAEPVRQTRPPVFNLHGSIVALSLACIAVHAIRALLLSRQADNWLLVNAAFWPIRYIPQVFTIDLPTLLSPITYAFLHGGWVHLGVNIVWLAAFGSPLAYRIGWARSLTFWLVTSVAAAAAHLAIYYGDPTPVIGASGAVSGFMGAAARFGLRSNRRQPRRGFDGPLLSVGATLRAPGVLPFLLIWVVMNVVIGLNLFGAQGGSPIAWEAHIGGLLAGFFLMPLFDRKPAPPPPAA